MRLLERDRQLRPKDRVLAVLHEPALENWGIRGGQAGCDIQLGFKIDV
jgi:hypothetical protein